MAVTLARTLLTDLQTHAAADCPDRDPIHSHLAHTKEDRQAVMIILALNHIGQDKRVTEEGERDPMPALPPPK